ncbi:MAG: hypothetical protein PVF27_08995 [Gemmatimonadales bacterium]
MSGGTGPNPVAVGEVASAHLGPILYALELCAVSMTEAGRDEEAQYYRSLARMLADAGGAPPPPLAGGSDSSP